MTSADEWAELYRNPMLDPQEPEQTPGPLCDKDGIDYDAYGGEREWQCGHPGTVIVPSGRLLCEDHAGELGYGPKQEEYGFDPADGDDRDDGPCQHEHDESCEDYQGFSICSHQHCGNCGGCRCPGYCDDYQTYNLRPSETGGAETEAGEPT